MKDYFTPKPISYNFQQKDAFCVPKVKTTTYGIKCLCFLGPKISNSLPNEIKSSQNINQFKALIKSVLKLNEPKNEQNIYFSMDP